MNFTQVNWAGWTLIGYGLFSFLVTPLFIGKDAKVGYLTFVISVTNIIVTLFALRII